MVGGRSRRRWAGGEVGRVKGEGRGGPGWGGQGVGSGPEINEIIETGPISIISIN